ncbi:MAG: argininosuccinate lyase [Spirochaetia bacterium]
MAKLWQKDYELNELLERFTVGIDYKLDLDLVEADAAASLAHAQMLSSIGILTEAEFERLRSGLLDIMNSAKDGKFVITKADEDGHTAIENYLVRHCGEAGKKIHTGRSRNDQVLAATRLWTRDFLLEFSAALEQLVSTLLEFAEANSSTPMPGRTHLQIAMPSTVGLWAAAWAESILDDAQVLKTVFDLNNRCPLGAAASYGVPLPLDREMVAELLGFSDIQNNVIAVNNSRGKIESMVLNMLEQVGITLSKAASDLILFSLPELGYFTLPDELCSGSSIMPQKKNPDGLELMRGKAASLSAEALRMKEIIRSLPSGYNRDFQETKEPLIKGAKTAVSCVRVMELTFRKLKVNEEKLRAAFTPEIFATDAALELVKQGKSFRDAYKEVGTNLDKLSEYSVDEVIRQRTATGTPGNLNLYYGKHALHGLKQWREGKSSIAQKALQVLCGYDPRFFSEVRE